MSSQNVGTTLVYMAYNTSTGAYQTADQANHTLKLVKDGTEASPTNASVEVDSTNAPGAYKLALTAAETQFGTVWLGGKSSTANVIIIPITATFEILPTALDANSNVKAGPDWAAVRNAGTTLDLSGTTIKNLDGNTVQTGDAFARLGAPAGASVSADVAAVKSDLDAGVNVTQVNGSATIEAGINLLSALRYMAAALAGQLSGASGPTITIQAIGNPATTRITVTDDSSGDRLSVTLS